MAENITPFFRNVWTDIFGGIGNFQEHPECAGRELEVVDCLEAYGIHAAHKKCRVVLDDFRECIFRGKQLQRLRIMSIERKRQFDAGERDEQYAEAPKVDAY